MDLSKHGRNRIMKYILLIVLLVFSTSGLTDTLAKDKKRLENLETELDQKKEALEKQKEAVKAMEKKLECNYNLLQAYNACEEKNKKESPEYVGCMQKAKEANAGCMEKA